MTVSLENALAFCREKVCKNLSSLHYATIFQPLEIKAFWLGCFALNHELRHSGLKQLEAGLTQIKLGWWRTALANTDADTNSHPIITAISKSTIHKIPPKHWDELIEQVTGSCEPKRYNSMIDWYADVHTRLKPWEKLIQASLDDPNLNCNELLIFWTEATRLCQMLRLAKYLDQGFQPLPIEILRQYVVTADQLKHRKHNESTRTLFSEISAQLIEQAQKAWVTIPLKQRLYAKPLRTLFRMRVAELHLHKSSQFKLLTEQKTIAPLKKFSIAWTSHVLRW